MNSFAVLILLVAFGSLQCASTEIFRKDSSILEEKIPEELDLNVSSANGSLISIETKQANNLPNCPSKCCKLFCRDGKFCTPAVAPVKLPTCDSGATSADSSQCYSPETAGCARRLCNPRANCRTNCGIVIDIINVAFCP